MDADVMEFSPVRTESWDGVDVDVHPLGVAVGHISGHLRFIEADGAFSQSSFISFRLPVVDGASCNFYELRRLFDTVSEQRSAKAKSPSSPRGRLIEVVVTKRSSKGAALDHNPREKIAPSAADEASWVDEFFSSEENRQRADALEQLVEQLVQEKDAAYGK